MTQQGVGKQNKNSGKENIRKEREETIYTEWKRIYTEGVGKNIYTQGVRKK